MLQKLLLAVTMTFALKLCLGVGLFTNSQAPTRTYLSETPTTVSSYFKEPIQQAFQNFEAIDSRI